MNTMIQHYPSAKRPWRLIIVGKYDWSYFGYYKTEAAALKAKAELEACK